MKFFLRALQPVDDLQFGKRVTVFGSSFLAIGLVLTACGNRDSRISQLVVGTWTATNGEVILDGKGTFHSQWRASSNRCIDFFGRWKLKDGALELLTTNVDSRGFPEVPRTGTIDTLKIIELDTSRLVLNVGNGQTNEFVRK